MNNKRAEETEKLFVALNALRLENEQNLKQNFDRSLPFSDGMFDRWERAKRLGFGVNTSIYDSAVVFGNVKVAENCWIGPNVILDGSGGLLKIGSYCSISAGVHIYTHDTVLWALSGGKLPHKKSSVHIGSNTYIGAQCLIVAGTSIGSKCVVAAHSLVTKDVEDRTVVGGVPAKIIGRVIGEGDEVKVEFNKK